MWAAGPITLLPTVNLIDRIKQAFYPRIFSSADPRFIS